jgi:hypothetical protein
MNPKLIKLDILTKKAVFSDLNYSWNEPMSCIYRKSEF